jgi:hypothetical protein
VKRKIVHLIQFPQIWVCFALFLFIVAMIQIGFQRLPTLLPDGIDHLYVGIFHALLLLLLLHLPHINFPIDPISRVLVAQFNPILYAGIQTLLQDDVNIVLRKITTPDRVTLLEEIASFKPHTVIVAGLSPLIDLVEVKMILNELPQIRLIVVCVQDVHLHIFEKKQLTIHNSDDFGFIVRSGTSRKSSQKEGTYVRNKLFRWNDFIEE